MSESTLALPGPIAKRAAQDAQAPEVLSVREVGKNRGEYIDIYNETAGVDLGSPYCASFQYTRLKKAAAALGKSLPKDFTPRAYTPDWKNWAQRKGLWIPVAQAKTNPAQVQVGDMALFYYSSMKRIGHIEVVVEVHDWGVVTIGANTGPDAGDDVERNGDGVYRKRRKYSQLGTYGGFCRLPF